MNEIFALIIIHISNNFKPIPTSDRKTKTTKVSNMFHPSYIWHVVFILPRKDKLESYTK